MGALVSRLARWLDPIRDLFWTLGPTRFSVIVVLVIGVGLAGTDQMQDVLLALAEDANPVGVAGFYAALSWWAFNVFYGARFILDRELRPLPKRPDAAASKARIAYFITFVPRALGLAAFAAVAIALACARSWALAATTIAIGGTFGYVFFWRRRWLLRQMYRLTGRRGFNVPSEQAAYADGGAEPGRHWDASPTAPPRRAGLRGVPPLAWTFVALNLALSTALFVFVCLDPADAGRQFGSLNFVFLATASWVAVGTTAVYFGEWSRLPVLVLLAIYIVLVSPLTDNHWVRALGGAAPENRSLGEAFEQWAKSPASAPTRLAAPPIIVVATEGGGIRAAYWTAFLLARIQEQEPSFRDSLFAVSSVSGGTIGSAVFDALLRVDDNKRRCIHYERKRISLRSTPEAVAGFTQCARAVLGQDLLSGTIGSLLYPDLAQRFVPLPRLPDRARAFEESLTAAWRYAVPEDGRLLAAALPAYDSDSRRHPVLLFNGTSVNTGQRVIASNVRITSDIFPDAIDFFEQFGHPASMATAAYTSARFPYVGPGGTYCTKCRTGARDRVVDGGYFENFGAGTAAEVVEQLHRWGKDKDRKILVITISSDPALGDDEDSYVTARCPKFAGEAGTPPRLGSELTIPPVTLLNTRSARGSLAMKQLKRRIDELGGIYVPFRMTVNDKAPLGWSLSRKARGDIEAELPAIDDKTIAAQRSGCPNGANGVAFARLLDALRLPDSGVEAWATAPIR